MIIYAVCASNVSVSAMFLGGIMPGIVLGLAEMLLATISHGNTIIPAEQDVLLQERFYIPSSVLFRPLACRLSFWAVS